MLLRFKADHTVGAVTAAEAKADPFKAQDMKAALLGNSLDAGIVAYFFWELFRQQEIMTNELEVKVVATRIPNQAEVSQRGRHQLAKPTAPESSWRWGAVTKEELMVAELIRRQTHRVRDISSTELRGWPTRWPRSLIPEAGGSGNPWWKPN